MLRRMLTSYANASTTESTNTNALRIPVRDHGLSGVLTGVLMGVSCNNMQKFPCAGGAPRASRVHHRAGNKALGMFLVP